MGGGASGCAAAAALADAGEEVLVLERGQSDLERGGRFWGENGMKVGVGGVKGGEELSYGGRMGR